MRVLRVLLIEDEAMIAMLLTEVIDQMGHVVCAVAATEDDAIAASARCQPDLMIVDEILRKGSGVSAVREILRLGPVPHIFVSGESLEDQTLRACLTRSSSHTLVSRSIILSKTFVRVLDPVCRAGSHARLKIA